MRSDGRPDDQLRPIKIQRHFTATPAGSVLWQQGNTIVLCTASITQELPPWMKDDRAGGWVTCEYVMLPASTPQRKGWPKTGHTDSRGTEIQRLIGRSIRAIVDLEKIGPHTIAIDCQVLQADGGTRTASICGAYIALVDAVNKLPPGNAQIPEAHCSGCKPAPAPGPALYNPSRALVDQLSAVSVGIIDGHARLDFDYQDDSCADVDMNVACTGSGKFVEIQGSAENCAGFDRSQSNRMLDLAEQGCKQIMEIQRAALTA